MNFAPGTTVLTIEDETMAAITQAPYGSRVFINIRVTDDNGVLYDPVDLNIVTELQGPPGTRVAFTKSGATRLSQGIYQIAFKPTSPGLWNVWDGTDQQPGDPYPSGAIASYTILAPGVSGV